MTKQYRAMTARDMDLIGLIVERAHKIYAINDIGADRTSMIMDVHSAHVTTEFGLDLKGLLEADDFNLMHDVGGIIRHMDRSKFPGHLTDCFRPRFQRSEPVDAEAEEG